MIIYEGAMCCSTGVCGPEPDTGLIELNETLRRLQSEFEGLEVIRASLSFTPFMFSENKEVLQLLKENGQAVLPVTTLNGKTVARQRYLKYAEIKEILEREINHG